MEPNPYLPCETETPQEKLSTKDRQDEYHHPTGDSRVLCTNGLYYPLQDAVENVVMCLGCKQRVKLEAIQ